MEASARHIVVGVVPDQPDTVVATAAGFAKHFDAELLCAWVDAGRYTVEERPDGAVLSLSIDPDFGDDAVEEAHPELHAKVARVLQGSGVSWSFRALAGGPSRELTRIADHVEAMMIVVGTRAPGIKGTIQEFFKGSVAAQLSHRQQRPVLVVPLNPVGSEGTLPWDAGKEWPSA